MDNFFVKVIVLFLLLRNTILYFIVDFCVYNLIVEQTSFSYNSNKMILIKFLYQSFEGEYVCKFTLGFRYHIFLGIVWCEKMKWQIE